MSRSPLRSPFNQQSAEEILLSVADRLEDDQLRTSRCAWRSPPHRHSDEKAIDHLADAEKVFASQQAIKEGDGQKDGTEEDREEINARQGQNRQEEDHEARCSLTADGASNGPTAQHKRGS
jgi:hypothetical protein